MTTQPIQSSNNHEPIYFVGCDMGGWHTDDGDAFAICKWDGANFAHVTTKSGPLFYPIAEVDEFATRLDDAVRDSARIVICIDAALAWPVKFVELVSDAPNASHLCTFNVSNAISNPYLYRETERFVKLRHLTGNGERPLTASGDKFGNNSSKAQVLSAWLKARFADIYRPPFDAWDMARALNAKVTLIEVYPAASQKSAAFRKLVWPPAQQSMAEVGKSDIADAKRCAVTGMCYAITVGLLDTLEGFPKVYLPDDPTASNLDLTLLPREGWIFAPHL